MTAQNLVIRWLDETTFLYSNDLKNMPEGTLAKGESDKTRSVAAITAEVGTMLGVCVDILGGNDTTIGDREGLGAKMGEAAAKMNSKEDAIAFLQAQSAKLKEALVAATDAQVERTFVAPWGDEMPAIAMVNIMVGNIFYHSGQLNYIQLLHGDDAMHWMEG
jgi:hypothetical protein